MKSSSRNNNKLSSSSTNSGFLNEEQELYNLIRRISIKYHVTSNIITKQTLSFIITKTFPKNETININEITETIFSKLTHNKSSSFSTYDFVKEINIQKNKIEIPKTATETFYKKIYNSLLTKTESIIYHLKHLQLREWISSNKELHSFLTWSILTVTEGDLYDLDTAHIKFKQSQSFSEQNNKTKIQQHSITEETKKSGMAYLAKYSNLENNAQYEKDFQILRSNSTRLGTHLGFSRHPTINPKSTKNTIQRRSTNLNSILSPSIIAGLYSQISKIDTIDFNIFEINDLIGMKTTVYVAHEILSQFAIVDQGIIPNTKLKTFLETIVEGYDRENAIYHNDLHGGDVMQTVYTIFMKGDLQSKMLLGELDTFSIIIAALCHDFKHTGQNNLFHINSKSKIAIRYNDFSVLENYHVAQTFKVLNRSECNIFKPFSPEEYRFCRKRMIKCILATDMANHQSILTNMKAKIASFNIVQGKNFEMIFRNEEIQMNLSNLFDSQQSVLNMIVHSADVSNPGKPEKISESWTKRVYEEFFAQGDLEKQMGLTVSHFCDRETTNINKAMIGFINYVVLPTFEILNVLIYETVEYKEYCKRNLKKYMNNVKKEEMKNKIETNRKRTVTKK